MRIYGAISPKFYHQIDDSGQLGKLLERFLKRMRCLHFIYSRSGFVQLNTEVPDTLTTWYSEAYGLHSATGLGVARQSQITVVKPFFVSLELPFSVNFGEVVTVTPLVFNLHRLTRSVTVSGVVKARVHYKEKRDCVLYSIVLGSSLLYQFMV